MKAGKIINGIRMTSRMYMFKIRIWLRP